MTEKYTIKDIAELAGLSKGTVDRVLHKRGKVSEKSLQKVNKVLEKIDYRPNLIARNLKQNKTYTFYVLSPDPKIDPYWKPCLEGIKNANEEYTPFNVFVETFHFNPESTESFLELNEKIIEKSPDAVLLAPLFYKETLKIIEKYNSAGILVSTFNNQVNSKLIKSFVGQDLVQSGRVAAKLLDSIIKTGHLAVVHINEVYKNAVHMQEKEKGFRDYFDKNRNLDARIITCKLKQSDFEVSLLNFLEENPAINGIFVTTSKTYLVAQAIDKLKKKIALIGYDLLDRNIHYLKNGHINFLIHQNQKMQAYLGLTSLFDRFLFSKEIPETKLLPIDIMNSENIKYYLP